MLLNKVFKPSSLRSNLTKLLRNKIEKPLGIIITSKRKVLRVFLLLFWKHYYTYLHAKNLFSINFFKNKPGFSELSAKIINFLELFKLRSVNEWNEYCKLDSFSIMKKLWIKLLMLLAQVNCRIASMNSQCYNLWLQINIFRLPKTFLSSWN